ncbi:hypothetical protein GOODEAATRI_031376 [Goodea atripinnis]|uniref:Uncharacterized protein n=1 Tax=Goodea atripinnis TaxID=208336 RepID=A0ABV0PT62_9TELE
MVSSSSLEALQRRFERSIYAEHAREQLISRQRLDGETLGSYATDILLRTRQSYPEVETVVKTQLAVQAFIRGLRPARLREHICVHSRGNWLAVLAEAERVEPMLCIKTNNTGARFVCSPG